MGREPPEDAGLCLVGVHDVVSACQKDPPQIAQSAQVADRVDAPLQCTNAMDLEPVLNRPKMWTPASNELHLVASSLLPVHRMQDVPLRAGV